LEIGPRILQYLYDQPNQAVRFTLVITCVDGSGTPALVRIPHVSEVIFYLIDNF
jgi:hypothetical protein